MQPLVQEVDCANQDAVAAAEFRQVAKFVFGVVSFHTAVPAKAGVSSQRETLEQSLQSLRLPDELDIVALLLQVSDERKSACEAERLGLAKDFFGCLEDGLETVAVEVDRNALCVVPRPKSSEWVHISREWQQNLAYL